MGALGIPDVKDFKLVRLHILVSLLAQLVERVTSMVDFKYAVDDEVSRSNRLAGIA